MREQKCVVTTMGPASTNKDLLQLESKSSTSSSLESTLLLSHPPNPTNTRSGKLVTSSLPKSQVLRKLKDFLGVMAEANTRLQQDAKERSSLDYDIEAVTGNETEDIEMVTGNGTEYIQMDLVLGVADLHTPEAVAAAEAAIAGSQSVPLVDGCGSKSDTSSDDDDSDDNNVDDVSNGEVCSSKHEGSTTDKEVVSSNCQPKKRQRIIELS